MKKATVSLCMITKNEERFLDQCLQSVRGIVDEIIIADTGSLDGTVGIAEAHGAQVCRYAWNESFADARNYALGLAKCDWILVMDADETFEEQDKQKFIDYIHTTRAQGCHFTIINYIGAMADGSRTLHNSLRLLRNNGLYRYEGAIHEQMHRVDGGDVQPLAFDLQDIRIHHYGYLNDVVQEKNKRGRNIPIIERLLEEAPDDSFMRFNLGNEYMAAGNYLAGLEQYDRAYAGIDISQAYAPHLIYRRAMCLYALRRMDAALTTLLEGLAIYPACTDYEYLRGTIHAECGRFTLAADCFERCLRMGEPPGVLKFMDNCATTRPLLALGQTYRRLEDYDRAIDCHIRAFNLDNSKRHVLYTLGELYHARYGDEAQVEEALWRCMTSRDHVPNQLVVTDILLHLRLVGLAQENLARACALDGCEVEKLYLQAKLHFANRDYLRACDCFHGVLESGEGGQLFAGVLPDSATWLATASMIGAPAQLEGALEMVRKHCDDATAAVYAQAAAILTGDEADGRLGGEDGVYAAVFTLLDRVLNAGEYALFEKLLNLYNHMESKAVLIHLAGVYLKNGFHRMAAQQVMRSIKELDYLDDKGVDILIKTKSYL